MSYARSKLEKSYMERKWVEYGTGPLTSRRGSISASAHAKGMFTFNRKTYEELGRPRAVVILTEEENSVIGLRPADPDQHNAYTVSVSTRGRGFRVACKRFFREFNIKLDCTKRLPTARIENGVLILELKYAVPATRSVPPHQRGKL